MLADQNYIQTIRRLKEEGAEYIDSQFLTALYMLAPGEEFTDPHMTHFMNAHEEEINSILEAALEGRDACVGAYLSALEIFADEICSRLWHACAYWRVTPSSVDRPPSLCDSSRGLARVGQELGPSRLRDHQDDLWCRPRAALHPCCHSAPLVPSVHATLPKNAG